MRYKSIILTVTLLLSVLLTVITPLHAQLKAVNGRVKFTSNAPLEMIAAASDKLQGALDRDKNAFAFLVDLKTFKGFNSDLQREHFHENYLETSKFPQASFSGKIIETVDYSKNGTYTVRAKGFLVVHGVKQERIIKGTMTIAANTLTITANFSVLLQDHDIKIPKIVNQKIAEAIKVDMNIRFSY
jgi:polyisoprenoid-binding protein YceI